MSTAIARNFQIGISPTATNNFTLYQPATPDGTLRLGNGNTGITSSLLTLTSAGDLGIGTSSPANKLNVFGSDATVRTESTSEDKGLLLVKSGVQGFAVTVNGAAQRLDFSAANAWPSISQIMSLTASGNVGIGTTSPGARLDVAGQADFTTVVAAGNGVRIRTPNGSGSPAILQFTNNPVTAQWGFISSPAAGVLTFGNATEYARFDSSGNLLVGTTSSTPAGIAQQGNITVLTASGKNGINVATIGPGNAIQFANTNFGQTGNIAVGANTTSYNTSSDYRLKENIAPMTGALARVSALKPVTYTWKSTGEADEGFIAHELAEVCPQAVTGEKDAVDKNGKPVYQGIDTSFLVATLTAAIQELKAEFDAYKATHP